MEKQEECGNYPYGPLWVHGRPCWKSCPYCSNGVWATDGALQVPAALSLSPDQSGTVEVTLESGQITPQVLLFGVLVNSSSPRFACLSAAQRSALPCCVLTEERGWHTDNCSCIPSQQSLIPATCCCWRQLDKTTKSDLKPCIGS